MCPVCPECKKEITKLKAFSDVKVIQDFWLVGDFPDYTDNERDFIGTKYKCPECLETLAVSEEEAINFLKSKNQIGGNKNEN